MAKSIIDLEKCIDKEVRVTFQGGREVRGALLSAGFLFRGDFLRRLGRGFRGGEWGSRRRLHRAGEGLNCVFLAQPGHIVGDARLGRNRQHPRGFAVVFRVLLQSDIRVFSRESGARAENPADFRGLCFQPTRGDFQRFGSGLQFRSIVGSVER